MEAHNSDIRASGEYLERLAAAAGSHLSELLEQHTANVDVAFQDAANSHQRVKFANELFMQQLIQHQDDMLSNAYQVEALATGAVRTLDIVNGQGADLRDTVEALSQAVSGVNNELRDTQDSVAALRSDVLVIAGHVSAIVGTIAGAFAHLPKIVLYLCSFGLIAGTLVFLMLCPGGLWTLQIIARLIIRCFSPIARLPGAFFRLIERTCIVASEDVPAILAIAGVTAYCTMFGSPLTAVERWQNDSPSPAEAALVVFVAVCLFFFLVLLIFALLHPDAQDERGLEDAIEDERKLLAQPRSRYDLGSHSTPGEPGVKFYGMKNERKGFWFNDPKSVRKLSGC